MVLLDALRLLAAALLVALAGAAVADRHRALLAYLGRVAEGALSGLVLAASFGRVRLPGIIRTRRRRAARRRRLRRAERRPAAPVRVSEGPVFRAGTGEDDDAPPGLI